ncbi:Predicted lipid-binding transport protein, Tim44 family [Microvirga guangxiensis]|uniref:Predicted lipid-binding transport protein, Tim44 family n=2 Tax=Microvirga guangxiensis TaxID=549386 RepID=A0A1G5L9M2_9HYPH|nr:TIM44-like domain-containing protein [Microvirga guangxiensis]SCZ09028.1 Predicted lipid-binding transport protein, Tim44 family [Microvirga guangxiensis]
MVALAAALVLAGSAAEARVGGGRGGFGSRGARTYSPPPATRTAPEAAAPIQRSQVPNQGQNLNRPGAPAPNVAQPRRFGFGTGLMAGLFGAGLLGMLMGNGFFGGLGGLASIMGLLLQVGLIVLLISFAMKWFRRRQEPAYAGPQSYNRSAAGGSVPPTNGTRPAAGGMGGGLAGGLGGLGGGALGGALGGLKQNRRRTDVRDEVGIGEQDFAAFERSLVELQDAYSRQDIEKIWSMATPEMAGYIQEELNDYSARGVVNKVSDTRLLQGDLSEAWREGTAEYATVAMRFSVIDVLTDKATGRVVEGDASTPQEATELWTFRRDQGSSWKISAIQLA